MGTLLRMSLSERSTSVARAPKLESAQSVSNFRPLGEEKEEEKRDLLVTLGAGEPYISLTFAEFLFFPGNLKCVCGSETSNRYMTLTFLLEYRLFPSEVVVF